MKNKFDFKIVIIIVLLLIFITICYFYFKEESSNYSGYTNYGSSSNSNTETVVLTATSQVQSALTEEIPLRAGYYFKEMLVSDNVIVKAGTKIVAYTNGNYLTAPYDLIITSYSVPESKKICNNTHYIKVSAFNVLSAQFRVDETKMDSIYIGKTVKVKLPALNDKEVEGIITDISSTASNGRFTVMIEFDNDGTIKLGMTINITVN